MSAWGSALEREATRHTSAAAARQAVLDQLVAERYGLAGWWDSSAAPRVGGPDTTEAVAERRRAMAADYARAEAEAAGR